MSVQATTWVWDHSQAKESTLLVALAIADAANKQGSESCQSVRTLSLMARCSESTVHRALRWLQEAGEIEIIGQNARYRGTNVYRFKAMWNPAWDGGTPVIHDTSQNDTPVTGGTEGVSSEPVTPVTSGTQPQRTPQETDPTSSSAGADGQELVEKAVDMSFEAWWTVCPRKVGKKAAKKAYEKALKEVGADALMAGLEAHLPYWATKTPEHIPHPATWLNEGRWEDRPEVPVDESKDAPPAEDPTAWMRKRPS